MALIKCPECGRDVSDRAASCPGCGCPVQQVLTPKGELKYVRTMTAEETAAYIEEKLAEGATLTSYNFKKVNPFLKVLAFLALIILIPLQLVFIFVTSISGWVFVLLGFIGGFGWLVYLITDTPLALRSWPFFAMSFVCFMLPAIAKLLIDGISALTEKLTNCITS